MTDECISTVEYITSAALKMSNKPSQQTAHNYDDNDGDGDNNDTVGTFRNYGIEAGASGGSDDRPDALGMGCEGSNANTSSNGLYSSNGKTV